MFVLPPLEIWMLGAQLLYIVLGDLLKLLAVLMPA